MISLELSKYSTVQYSTVQYSTVHYATLRYTTLHYTTLKWIVSGIFQRSFNNLFIILLGAYYLSLVVIINDWEPYY